MHEANRWIINAPASESSGIRLFCLPHAGGAASAYLPWRKLIADFVHVSPIQLPGRESRLNEPPQQDLDTLVTQLARVVEAQDVPYALFGHSMGAGLSYRVARALHEQGLPGPVHLFVSSFRAPHMPSRLPRYGDLDEDATADVLDRLGGIPAEIAANAEFMRLVMPSIRADLLLVDQMRVPDTGTLDCPITAFGGDADEHASVAELEGWREHTNASFRVRVFEGGHFYLRDQAKALLADIADDLAAVSGDV